MAAVRCFATGQIKGDEVSAPICFGMNFCRKSTARSAERLTFLPPFAPAVETCALTIVESNIWIRCADGLSEASISKKASNTPALLSRSNRFHTLFQLPYSFGSARQRTFSTVKNAKLRENCDHPPPCVPGGASTRGKPAAYAPNPLRSSV